MKRLIALLLSLLMMTAGLPAHATESTGTVVVKAFASTTADFPNPERGFYRGGSNVPPYFYIDDFSADSLSATYATGARLVIGVENLSSYVGTDTIDSGHITNLNSKFALLRAAHLKVILRMAYNYSSVPTDASLARITAHLSALRQSLRDNADVIAYYQDGFVGQYGEWFNSNNFGSGNLLTSNANLKTLHTAIRNTLHPRTFQMQRYPRFLGTWYPAALTSLQAFSGAEQAMTGTHNDCFLNGNNDVGTFSSSTLSPISSNTERQRLANESNWTPFGGETCDGDFGNGPTRFTCSLTSGIMFDGPAYHLTFLNELFSTTFISNIKSGGCYDTVRRQMGYRFQLDSVSHQGTATAGQTLTFNVSVRNVGWSRIFSERRVQIRLMNGASVAASAMSAVDLRQLPPQATATQLVPVKGLVAPAAGTYTVEVCSPDVWASLVSIADYKVRFANADAGSQAWNATTGCMKTGSTVTTS